MSLDFLHVVFYFILNKDISTLKILCMNDWVVILLLLSTTQCEISLDYIIKIDD